MQKWETMIASVYPVDTVSRINSKTLDKPEPIMDFLLRTGNEGWEIAGVVGDKNSHTIYLKRPVTASRFEEASSN